MRTRSKDAVNEFVEELRRLFPDIQVVVLPGRKVRLKVASPQDVGSVFDAAAELQTQWILEKGVNIQVGLIGPGTIN